MEKELRELTIKDIIDRKYNSNIDIIAIGSERCANYFCKQLETILKQGLYKGLRIALVTPKVPNEYFNYLLDLILQLNKVTDIAYIVVNDYGLLYALNKRNIKNIILGRILIRSISYSPWKQFFVKNEDSPLQENLKMVNLIHDSKLKLFKKFNIQGFEICNYDMTDKIIELLHNRDFTAHVHQDTFIATIGRTCPNTRLLKQNPQNCSCSCENPLDINLNRIWISSLYFKECDKNKCVIPMLKGRGNAIYYRNTEKSEITHADVLIYDNKIDKDILE